MSNLFANLPVKLPHELTQILIESQQVRIERIVSWGHASPVGFWYDQDEAEFVVLIQGGARLQFEDDVLEMSVGDWVHIPAHRKHRVLWTTPEEQTIWLAVFFPH